jgi:hypothetical protein
MVNLSNSFAAHGHRVDLIMARRKGHFLGEIQPGVRVLDPGPEPSLLFIA